MLNCPHCNTHIDEHPASRCLDAWVEQAVIDRQLRIKTEEWGLVPRYSTDIAAAWEVVEKFRDYDWKLYSHGEGETMVIYKDGTHYEGDASTAPLAICRAAIKATA